MISAANPLVFDTSENGAGVSINLAAIEVDGQILTTIIVNPAFGPNGVKLQFEDPDDLDGTSGNGNDYTPNAISILSGLGL